MIFQEKYELNNANAPFFSDQFDLIITDWNIDANERNGYFKSNLKEYRGTFLEISVCENIDKLSYRISDNAGNLLSENFSATLIPGLQNLIKNEFQNLSVCIDITSVKQPILFLLIKIFFTTYKPKRLFASYTEPESYIKKVDEVLVGGEEYDLYEKLMEVSVGVPGFNKHRDFQRDDLLIASIGFESQRLYKVYDNIKPKKFIPIIGFPSFVPGWNQTALKVNHLVIRQSESQYEIIKVEAASPFYLYDILKKLFNQYSEKFQILLSPLGTRPHSLGIAMFAANNPNTYLIYDFPLEKKYRSKGILKTSIFHLSNYINY